MNLDVEDESAVNVKKYRPGWKQINSLWSGDHPLPMSVTVRSKEIWLTERLVEGEVLMALNATGSNDNGCEAAGFVNVIIGTAWDSWGVKPSGSVGS